VILLQRRLLHSGLMFLTTKVIYCSLQLQLNPSFLFDLLLHDLGSLGHFLSSGHMHLHESKTPIFLVKVRQLILDDCFDLLFRVLLWFFLSFDALLLVWCRVVGVEVFIVGTSVRLRGCRGGSLSILTSAVAH
jgi:hypothetical protein